jgi:hypothetical protein
MKVLKVEIPGLNPYITASVDGVLCFLQGELKDNAYTFESLEIGSKITITVLEMTHDELSALPEWEA